MTQVTFNSSSSVMECLQRIEELAAVERLHLATGRFKMILGFEPAVTDGDTFTLFVRCSRHRFELPTFVNYKVNGELWSSPEGSTIHLVMQLHGPFTKSDWFIHVFWALMLFLSLAGGIISFVHSSMPQTFLIGSVLFLGWFSYLGMVIQTYRAGNIHIPKLLVRYLQEEKTTISGGLHSKSPGWLSSLRDSNG